MTQSSEETDQLSVPPLDDELEVTIFGPGKGESVVVHVGGGEWLIVDSCLSPASKEPVPLAYLSLLGVDVRTEVAGVIATHWHDDHVAGLGEVVKACQTAPLWVTPAMQAPELKTLLAHYTSRKPFVPFTSGVEEMANVITELRRSGRGLDLAFENCCIIHPQSRGGLVEVICLAPSTDAQISALARLTAELRGSLEKRLRIPAVQENDCSTVLRIRVRGHSIILGGDLEEQDPPNPAMGWNRAASIHHRQGFGKDVHVFKVPHHGSVNGYHAQTWNTVLQQSPWALLTPFRGSSNPLPAPEGLAFIKQHTDKIYLTASSNNKRARIQDASVLKTTNEATKGGIKQLPRNGAVRLRCKIGDPAHVDTWRVEVFGSASKVL